MPAGYWILIACVVVVLVLMRVHDRRAERQITELEAALERAKGEFRSHEAELRKYKDMCRRLLDENAQQKAALSEVELETDRLEQDTEAARHLELENMNLAYREGLVRDADFSDETLVRDLRAKSAECDVEATLLCFDSGIRMSFTCAVEDGAPVLRVILRVPEGGACCIYEDGSSDPEEDWPPVRACLDTMFARGREVYLSYTFGHRTA